MNKILLRPQEMTLAEYQAIANSSVGRFKKIFFQFELREFSNGDAVFGLVLYGGYRKNGKKIGPPFWLRDMQGVPDKVETPPLIFGNLEFKRRGQTISSGKLLDGIRKLIKTNTKANLKNIALTFSPNVSKNPHAYYDVTAGTTAEATNPSPPAPPSDF